MKISMRGRKIFILRSLAIATLLLIVIGQVGGKVSAAKAPTPLSICDTPVRIMPLGDSITVGKYSGLDTSEGADSDDIGYRKDLKDLLNNAGYSTDFVGSQTNGQTYPGFTDPQHEGHNGWTDTQVLQNIYNNGGANWLGNYTPDIILLHIGTNNLNPDPSEVEGILNEIDEYENATGRMVIVILARIIDMVPNNQFVNQFNNNVQAMASARTEFGNTLFMVDMEDGAGLIYAIQPSGDFIDPLHPWSTGYTKMANVWKTAIDTVFNQLYDDLCNNTKPTVTQPPTQTNSEGDVVNLQIEAGDAENDPMTFVASGLPADLTINSESGLISGTINYSASTNSPYTVVIQVNDGKPGSPTEVTFTWTVTNTNRAPQITNPPSNQSSAENDSISLQVDASDPDGDSLTFSAVNLPPGLGITSSGLISGTISYEAAAGSPFNVQVTVRDNGSPQLEDTASFTWSVSNVNRPPSIDSAPGGKSSVEGQNVNVLIEASDPDGDSLSFSAVNLPDGLAIDPETGVISGKIGYNAHAGSPYSVEITVSDNGDLSDTHAFEWSVVDANGPPQVTSPGNQIGYEGDSVNLYIQASDPDDGDNLQFSANGLPPGLTINKVDKDTARISGKIASGASSDSPYTVTVTVTDNGSPGKSASVLFTWQVVRSVFSVFLPMIIK